MSISSCVCVNTLGTPSQALPVDAVSLHAHGRCDVDGQDGRHDEPTVRACCCTAPHRISPKLVLYPGRQRTAPTSPTRVLRSSFPFLLFPPPRLLCLAWHWKVVSSCFKFPLLHYFDFLNVMVIFGIDAVVHEWLSHGMPLPAPGGEGKLELRPTVTRLSLGCLILVRSLI